MTPLLLVTQSALHQTPATILTLSPRKIATAPNLSFRPINLNPTTGPFDTAAPNADIRRPGQQILHYGRYTPVVTPLGTQIGSPTYLSKSVVTFPLGGSAGGPDCGTYVVINKTPILLFDTLSRIGYNVLQASTDNRLLLQTRSKPPKYAIYNQGHYSPLPEDATDPQLASDATVSYLHNGQYHIWKNNRHQSLPPGQILDTLGPNGFYSIKSIGITPPADQFSPGPEIGTPSAKSKLIFNQTGDTVLATPSELIFTSRQTKKSYKLKPLVILPQPQVVALDQRHLYLQSTNQLYLLTIPANL